MEENPSEAKEDFYVTDGKEPTGQSAAGPLEWTASEFLYHQKSASWYLLGAVGFVVASLLLFVLTRDSIGPIAVVVLGALLLVGASRKPRTVSFLVDEHGIVIANKEYAYNDFQSFSVVQEDQIESIALFPHKRFAPVVSLYFPPESAQKIFDTLSDHLPFEQREKDGIDKFLHRIKF